MTIKDVFEKSILFLKNKNFPTPRLDAEILISHQLKLKRMDLYLKLDKPLQESEIELCRKVILDRSKGIPVAYLISEKGFYGLDFKVSPAVLIPRPETELLVEMCLQHIITSRSGDSKSDKIGQFANTPINSFSPPSLQILELGSGSGCISISIAEQLLKKIPQNKNSAVSHNNEILLNDFQIDSIDISEAAIGIAKINCREILKNNSSKINFLLQDAFNYKPSKKYDIIISNPPYIAEDDPMIEKNVKDFEPHLALFAKNNGLDCIQKWFRLGVENLKPNGFILFEIGQTQGNIIQNYVSDLRCFHSIEIIKDYARSDRFIKAVRNG